MSVKLKGIDVCGWGNGDERFRKLSEAGYNYDQVQRCVNQILYK